MWLFPTRRFRLIHRIDLLCRQVDNGAVKKPSVRKVRRVQKELHAYLDIELDPFDFDPFIREWMEEVGIRWEQPDEPFADDLTPAQLKQFTKWLVDTEKSIYYVTHDPLYAPAYLVFSEVSRLPAGSWGIHFTDADPFEAFDQGSTIQGLALSTWKKEKDVVDCAKNLGDDIGPFETVFGFAFLAGQRNILSHGSKYGRNAVLFQTDGGVRAWHSGDEEYQMIFPLCSEYNVIPLYNPQPGEITVETKEGKELIFSSVEDVADYAGESNAQQLRLSGPLVRVEH